MPQALVSDTEDDESSGTPSSLPGLIESSSDSDTELRYEHRDGGITWTRRGARIVPLPAYGAGPRG